MSRRFLVMNNLAVLFVIFGGLGLLSVTADGAPITAASPARLALAQPSTRSNMPTTPQRMSPRKARSPSQVLFDDFNYSKHREMTKHGWIIRNVAGWPGVPAATWWPEGVSFLRDPDKR